MTEPSLRNATLADLPNLWGLMRQVAGCIPFNMASEAEQESLLTEAMCCCTAELSPVAVGEGATILGALLVRRDDFDWCVRKGDALHIAYAAIAPGGNDLLSALIDKVQARKAPIYASVKAGNALGLAQIYEGMGFKHQQTAESGWGDLYKWQPENLADGQEIH